MIFRINEGIMRISGTQETNEWRRVSFQKDIIVVRTFEGERVMETRNRSEDFSELFYPDQPVALEYERFIAFQKNHRRYTFDIEEEIFATICQNERIIEDLEGIRYFVEEVLRSSEVPEELKAKVKQKFCEF